MHMKNRGNTRWEITSRSWRSLWTEEHLRSFLPTCLSLFAVLLSVSVKSLAEAISAPQALHIRTLKKTVFYSPNSNTHSRCKQLSGPKFKGLRPSDAHASKHTQKSPLSETVNDLLIPYIIQFVSGLEINTVLGLLFVFFLLFDFDYLKKNI